MKLNIIALLVVAAAVAASPLAQTQAQTQTQKEQEYLTYTNNEFGFEIQYPSNWTKVEVGGTVGFTHEQDYATIDQVEKASQVTNNLRVNQDNTAYVKMQRFAVESNELFDPNMTLTEFVDFQDGIIRYQGFIENNAITALEGTPILFEGKPAHKIVYVDSYGQKATTIFSIHNNKSYTIGYSTNLLDTSGYDLTIQKMLDSFRFIEEDTKTEE